MASSSFSLFESIKSGVAHVSNAIANNVCEKSTVYLATDSLSLDPHDLHDIVINCFNQLNEAKKGQVYEKVWELANMQNSNVFREAYEGNGVFEDESRLAKALHRLGFLNHSIDRRHPVTYLAGTFGEGRIIGSQYFSLKNNQKLDPQIGQIGYVNGMGFPNLPAAKKLAVALSADFVYGYNIHGVYHASHVDPYNVDLGAFIKDI